MMRSVMDSLLWQAEYRKGRKRPLLYRCVDEQLSDPDFPITLLGHYDDEAPNNRGCDSIGSARAVYELIREVGNGIVLCEGLLLSEDSKWAKQLVEDGAEVRVYFLSTPLDVCLNRIVRRRKDAGNEKPLNPANTTNRVEVIERARRKLAEAGVWVRRCSSEQAPRLITNELRLYAKLGER